MKVDSPQLEREPSGDLHPVLWLGAPLFSLGMMWITPLLGFRRWKAFMMDETGFIEIATVVFLLPAIVLGVWIFARRRRLPKGAGCVMLLGALAALYFAGEEISWGQSWIHFKTPEAFAEKNVQGEFNLHNFQGWGVLNNAPRQLMLLGTIVGGLILPLVLRRRFTKPEARRSFWYWVIPTWRLVPICLIAACSTVPEKIYKQLIRPYAEISPEGYANMAFIDPAGEFKEYCFALVILLYMLSVYLRTRKSAKRQVASAGL
jgi:hypothetical protein